MKAYVVTCPHCKRQYDLLQATERARGKEIYCPNCKKNVGKRNN